MINKFLNWMFKPTSSYSLAIFRIIFGLVLIYEFVYVKYLLLNLQYSNYLVQYDFFTYFSLPSESVIKILYPFAIILCVFFVLGFFFRISSILIFSFYTYAFLLDKGHYNNHYYLYCIILLFFSITNANNSLSLDSKISFLKKGKGNLVYNWEYLIFKIQFLIVYFFGGIAKIQGDWLQGFPLRYWLYENSFNFNGFLQFFYQQESTAYIYSYLGLIFDLTVGFLLFHKKYRWYALFPIIFFHLSNVYLWNIGSFPFAMIIALIIFFEDKLNFKNTNIKLPNLKQSKRNIIIIFFAFWFTFQLLFPLRQHLYPGNPSFNGQGHLFAWRMMLVDNLDAFKMKVEIPNTTDEFYIDPLQYINFAQFRKMSRTPISYLAFAHYIKEEISVNTGIDSPIIKMYIYKSINGRTPALLNDTSLNYSDVVYNPLKTQTWINDWSDLDEKPVFSIQKYERWQEVVNTNQ